MSFPPPPPSNQPPQQPPQGAPGGFGPPGGGYGPGGQQPGPGGYGPGGYGPSAPPTGPSPAGPYGPPAGGFGPPGPGGPGGWQQPPAPPSGGGSGTTIALIIGAGVLAVALVVGCVIWANSGDGGGNQARPSTGPTAGPTPAASDSGLPSPSDSPTATPSGPETTASSSSGRTVAFYALKTGDCYDIPPGGNGGNNASASCTGPHDAEVVFVYTLPGGLASAAEIKDRASALCASELQYKASRQPAGTAEGTYVQFPSANGYKMGIKSAVCSLTGNHSGTRKLTKPLR
ncbi:hypothetical protein [Streptomyces sp. CB02959]|uniref:hypothetical protein n=1 Tax=Streptomyces sp. CB02959 TaxID=2020330 RepID=UPI000C274CB8|nr:hypothetical protein [Streptomyces sp. CB02959]